MKPISLGVKMRHFLTGFAAVVAALGVVGGGIYMVFEPHIDEKIMTVVAEVDYAKREDLERLNRAVDTSQDKIERVERKVRENAGKIDGVSRQLDTIEGLQRTIIRQMIRSEGGARR